ncbi:MAG: hypothetical protein ACAI25_19075, partial [Planctomycetota bacterium]
APPPPPSKRAETPPPQPRPDPDRTFSLLCVNVDTAPEVLVALGQAKGFSCSQVPQQSSTTWTLTGSPASLQPLAVRGAYLQLEDPAAFARVVPPPLDKVQLRSGEIYGGKLVEDGRVRVVLETTPGPGVEAGRRPLTLSFPRRSVVRVIPAPCEAVSIHVVLKSRGD